MEYTPLAHQEELSDLALSILRDWGLVYLASEERTGKSLTAIRLFEKSLAKNCLIITKKKAFEDWEKLITINYKPAKPVSLTTWQQFHKVDISRFDLIILDESHNFISSYPKPSSTHKKLSLWLRNKPIVYISATPHPRGYQQLYHQFSLSSFSPWIKYSNFYKWFKVYGKPYTIKIQSREANQYDRTHEQKILNDVKHLFVTKTREELGFDQEPVDKLHYIEPNYLTRFMYNELLEHSIYESENTLIVCETESKLRFTLHMLEGGVAKSLEGEYLVLPNNEKVNFIKETFGDTEDIAIMFNYKAEKIKLESAFKHALILQATSNAEGVDLSHVKHLIIYSQDFSTGRHTQRRARQCNINRSEPITVHYLLFKNAISDQCYKIVSRNKKNFVDSVFKRSKL